jgi:hypothetical protein
MKQILKSILNRLPYISSLHRKVNYYENALMVPPGHFYSPIGNQEELINDKSKIFDINKKQNGIDLNEEEQFNLLQKIARYYTLLPFTDHPIKENRYYFENDAFKHADAVFLFGVMMHFKPKRIMEIGSGHSSALMLDINEHFFQNSIDLTFIEPFPGTLNSLTKSGDRFTLINQKVQDVDLNVFAELEADDILFIDSTHVAKTNSDVLYELFEILPKLKKGVKIHIHDIFFPFEYPEEWVIDQKRNWNEIYFLKAFLMYNSDFKILAFNTFLEHTHEEWFEKNMPICLKDTGGSIWLEKTHD